MRPLSRRGRLYMTLRAVRNRYVSARKRLAHVHPTATVNGSAVVARDVRAGAFVFVGPGCRVPAMVTIGKYSMLAEGVSIVGDDHNWHDPTVPMQFAGRPAQQATVIGADVWLGHGATLLRGVTVGDGAIVGAGALVTHDVPGCEIWGGLPARKLRDRFDAAQRRQHLEMLRRSDIRPTFASEPSESAARDG